MVREMTNSDSTIFLLDKSGSMFYNIDDTIGGYNSFVKGLPSDSLFAMYMFSDKCECHYDNVSVKDVPELTSKEYVTQGNTALFDSMGEIILKYKTGKFVILTDGCENASKKFTKDAIKDLIKASSLEIVYIGADLECAKDIGITRTRHYTGHDSPAAFAWASQQV